MFSAMVTQVVPQRIVLKCPGRHGKVQSDVVTTFFNSQGLEFSVEDLYIHILFDHASPSSLFFVLDLHCKTIPHVDLSKLELQIFEVSKKLPLYV